MVKVWELSESKQVGIKYLCLNRLSYAEIGRQIGCNKSVSFKVSEKFELVGSVEKRQRCGHPKNGQREESDLSAEVLDN